MSRARQAREQIKAAMKDAGGVYAVAEVAGLHFTQVYAFLRGASLRPENAGKLRAVLPGVAAEVWADVAAPISAPPAEPVSDLASSGV
jgi:hypothetical protein